jgi:hypothetical protein
VHGSGVHSSYEDFFARLEPVLLILCQRYERRNLV